VTMKLKTWQGVKLYDQKGDVLAEIRVRPGACDAQNSVSAIEGLRAATEALVRAVGAAGTRFAGWYRDDEGREISEP
jgi:hypothetical protein